MGNVVENTNNRGQQNWIKADTNRLPKTRARQFSFNPKTGKLWSGHDLQTNDSVKGTYFPDIKTLYLFDADRQDVLEKAEELLQKSGLPDDHRVIWGPLAAAELSLFFSGL